MPILPDTLAASPTASTEELLETLRARLGRAHDVAQVPRAAAEVAPAGFGPLEPLLAEDGVCDILVNGPHAVYVERNGRLELSDVRFRDEAHLMEVIHQIVRAMGRRVDVGSPMVDARLPDGSRVNAIIPPVALRGPCLSIRRFGRHPYHFADLVRFGSLTIDILRYLAALVHARLNIIVSGASGAGKTTLLNCLTSFIEPYERIVTIEDSAELQLQQPHVVPLETRPPDLRGLGEVTARDLVRNALRMRADRIIVGEVRSTEALDMLQAMNTGHDGSISTLHANSPRDCLRRLEMMVLMAGIEMPIKAVRQQVSSAINAMLHVSRMPDGSRKLTRVTEIVGMEEEAVQTQDLFIYEQTGVDADNRVRGHFRPTGLRSRYYERMVAAGVDPTDIRVG